VTLVLPRRRNRGDHDDVRFIRPLLVILSATLMAAHFLRTGSWTAVAIILALPLLLLVKQAWAGWMLRVLLIAGAIEWVRTAAVIARQRIEAGDDWLRMAVILGAVAAVTALAAALVRVRTPAAVSAS
jgi:hypothetical protein